MVDITEMKPVYPNVAGGGIMTGLFLSILWPKFGNNPNGKLYLFPPIIVPKFHMPKIRKYVVKQRFLESEARGELVV